MTDLWCYIERERDIFGVTISPDCYIDNLKKTIKEKRSNRLLTVDSPDLSLTKVDVDLVEVWNVLEAGQSWLNTNDQELDPMDVISDVWERPPHDRLHVFVRLPAVVGIPTLVTVPAVTRDLWPAITITAVGQGEFCGQAALERNWIFELDDDEPDFLTEFRAKLRQPRCIDSDTNTMYLKEEVHEFDNYFQYAPTDDGQRDRASNERILWHLAGAFLAENWKNGTPIKEANVRWIFDQLAWYFGSVFGSRGRGAIHFDWPIKLIVSVKSEQTKYHYTPRSYFHVSVDRLIYLLVEVQSDVNQGDRYRMLLQAACVTRLGRLAYDKPFIVMALYIDYSGMVTRYLVFQPDSDSERVCFVSDLQDWNQPSDLFTALFEIYNLGSMIESDGRPLESVQRQLLNMEILKNFKDPFISKVSTRTKDDTDTDDTDDDGTRTTKRSKGGNTGNGSRRGEDVYHDHQVVAAFTRAGYTLESNDEDENGWVPLNQLKPTMRHAVRSDGTAVVVKLLRPRSDELGILQCLDSIKSARKYTIPLLGTLKLNMGTFIFLPEATPLDLGFKLGKFRGKVVDFSWQLLEGVGFLHRHGIAHLDIKPANIVALLRNQLFIIDFDISVRVDGPDALIDRWCGTSGWMAPEIGDEDGPKCWYSPIRADLWSCGLMLRYLASKGAVGEKDPLKALAEQLLNRNARLRPLLYPGSSVTVGHPLSEPQGGLKRKPDTLPHDAKRQAIGTVHT